MGDSLGRRVELKEVSVLVGGARPEVAGNGQGSPATARATRCRGSEVGGREREWEGVTRSGSDQTGLNRFDPVGSDWWVPRDLVVV